MYIYSWEGAPLKHLGDLPQAFKLRVVVVKNGDGFEGNILAEGMEFLEGACVLEGLFFIGHAGVFHFFSQGFGEGEEGLLGVWLQAGVYLVNQHRGGLELTLVQHLEEVLDFRNSFVVGGGDDDEGGARCLEKGLCLAGAFSKPVIELSHGEEEFRQLLQGLYSRKPRQCLHKEVVAVLPEAKAPAAGGEHGQEEVFGDFRIQKPEESAWSVQEVQRVGSRRRIQNDEAIVSAHFKFPEFFDGDVFLGAGEGIGEGLIEAVVEDLVFLAGGCVGRDELIPSVFHVEHHRPEGGVTRGGGVVGIWGEAFQGNRGFVVTQVVYTEGIGEAFGRVYSTHEAFASVVGAPQGQCGSQGGFADAAGAYADEDVHRSEGSCCFILRLGAHRSPFIFFIQAARAERVFRVGCTEGTWGSLKVGGGSWESWEKAL